MYQYIKERELSCRVSQHQFDSEIFQYKQSVNYHQKLHLLRNTGFHVELQTNQLVRELENSKTPKKTIEEWIEKTTEDMSTFIPEFLKQQPILFLRLSIDQKEGRERVVAPDYQHELLVGTTSKTERNGATHTGIEDLEQKLIAAPNGSIIVRTSPAGKEFNESQTQIVYKKNPHEIQSYTVRTKMNTENNWQLLRYLGTNIEGFEGMNEQQKVEAITKQNALIHPDMHESVESIVELLKDISGNCDHKGRSFDLIFSFLSRFHQGDVSFQMNDIAYTQIINFKQFALDHMKRFLKSQITDSKNYFPFEFIDNLQVALGLTVLQLQTEEIHTSSPTHEIMLVGQPDQYLMHAKIDYENAYKKLQSAGGCSNKGSSGEESLSEMANPLSQYQVSLAGIREKKDYKNDPNLCRCGNKEPHFHCPGKNKEGHSCNNPIIVGRGITQCPKCGQGAICKN